MTDFARIPPPFTGPELVPVAARLDAGLDCSRYESRRLLATVRLLQQGMVLTLADLESTQRAIVQKSGLGPAPSLQVPS